MIGLDTTAIIDIFKGEESLRDVLLAAKGPLVTTQMNYLEIFFGIDGDNVQYKREIGYYDAFFDEVRVLALDRESSRSAAALFWKLKKKGRTIEKFDCIIAAIFLTHGVTSVITRNKKHFERIPGLRVVTY